MIRITNGRDLLQVVRDSGWPVSVIGPTAVVRPPDGRPVRFSPRSRDTRAARNSFAELRRAGIETALELRAADQEHRRYAATLRIERETRRREEEARTMQQQRQQQEEIEAGRATLAAWKAERERVEAPMTVREVGDVLGRSHKTVQRLIDDGELPATHEETHSGRWGFRYVVKWADLVEYVERTGA